MASDSTLMLTRQALQRAPRRSPPSVQTNPTRLALLEDDATTRLPGSLNGLGNQGMLRLLRTRHDNRQPTTEESQDRRAEEEAERTAERVMRMPDARFQSLDTPTVPALTTDRLRTKQTPGSPRPVTADAKAHAPRGRGKPLPGQLRAFFEPRFGADLRGVRIHDDARATDSARTLHARAFTIGHDISFAGGQYQPQSREGRQVLAHELTHVVQQRALREASVQAIILPGCWCDVEKKKYDQELAKLKAAKAQWDQWKAAVKTLEQAVFFHCVLSPALGGPGSSIACLATQQALETAKKKREEAMHNYFFIGIGVDAAQYYYQRCKHRCLFDRFGW